MAEIKLTKNEMKVQQQKLMQLERYLPTLQLKKALLQAEIAYNKSHKGEIEKECQALQKKLDLASPLLNLENSYPFEKHLAISQKEIASENIAGADLPLFRSVHFHDVPIDRFATPPWLESFLNLLKETKRKLCAWEVAKERVALLERELNDVSTRVNLFEKILIPRCKENIKRIKIFLSDVQLAAVSQAKVAKAKIVEREQKRLQVGTSCTSM